MNKKKYLIFIIVGVLIIVALLFYFFSKKQAAAPENNNIQTENPGEKTADDLNNFNKAQETKNLDFCNLINDKSSKDFCVKELALATNSDTICKTIEDINTRLGCAAEIIMASAVAEKNLIKCETIEIAMLQKTCVERIAENNSGADCSKLNNQNLKDTCLSISYYQEAKTKSDAKICEQIPELIRRANCLSEIKNIDLHSDADKDGLDFLQEILNGTNPNNPDTDGDSFLDGAEFAGGFNPDGAGSLNLVVPSNFIECEDIKDEQIRAICILELKNQALNLSACDKLKDSELKAYCLNQFFQPKK